MGFSRLYQAKLLRLWSGNTEWAMMELRRVCDAHLEMLGYKKLHKHSVMKVVLNKVHDTLLKMIRYLKVKGVDIILTYSVN